MAWGEREQGAQAPNYYENPTFFTIRFHFYEGAFRGEPVRYIDNVDPQTFSFRQLNRMVRLLGYTTIDYFNAQILVPGIEMAYINMKDEQYFELVSSVGRFHKEVNLRLERMYDSTHNSDGMWVRVMPSHTESSDSSDEDSSEESSDESSDEYLDEDSEIPNSGVDSMESDDSS